MVNLAKSSADKDASTTSVAHFLVSKLTISGLKVAVGSFVHMVVGQLPLNCGHVYHDVCLEELFMVCRTCPQCHIFVIDRHVKTVYLNFSPESDKDYQRQNDELVCLKEELAFKESELLALEEDIKQLRKLTLDGEQTGSHLLQRWSRIQGMNTRLVTEMSKIQTDLAMLSRKLESANSGSH